MKLDFNNLEDNFGSNLNFEGNFSSLRASHLNCILLNYGKMGLTVDNLLNCESNLNYRIETFSLFDLMTMSA